MPSSVLGLLRSSLWYRSILWSYVPYFKHLHRFYLADRQPFGDELLIFRYRCWKGIEGNTVMGYTITYSSLNPFHLGASPSFLFWRWDCTLIELSGRRLWSPKKESWKQFGSGVIFDQVQRAQFKSQYYLPNTVYIPIYEWSRNGLLPLQLNLRDLARLHFG